MAIARALPAELEKLIQNGNALQIAYLFRSLREPAVQSAVAFNLLAKRGAQSTASAQSVVSDKPKKALNSFVAFRTYYIRIPGLSRSQMKNVSNPIAQLWDLDKNHSLWTLIAKAWSFVRDQVGKKDAPLDSFLRIICPYLEIPSPEEYLDYCGWKIEMRDAETWVLLREFDAQQICPSSVVTDMALSVADIIAYVQLMGYAQNFPLNLDGASSTFLAQTQSIQDLRAAARDRRRNSHQARLLREEISFAHTLAPADALPDNEIALPSSGDSAFYNNFANVLTNHFAHGADTPSQSSTMGMPNHQGDLTGNFFPDNVPNELSGGLAIDMANDSEFVDNEMSRRSTQASEEFVAGFSAATDIWTDQETQTLAPVNDLVFDFSEPPNFLADWDAFRTGADGGITLPSFESADS